MTVSEVCRHCHGFAAVGTRRVEFPFPERWAGAEPGSPALLLSSRLAERRGADQRFPGIRPPIRMSVVAIVDRQPPLDSFLERLRIGEVTPLEEPATQDTEEQFHLVEPRTVNGCEVEHVLVARVDQERPAFPAGL